MRWFPAFNYIEARMAQAHLFDPLTENIAKFKQTPNEETLSKITQILDGLYVPHNLSLTKSNDNSLIIAYKRYRSYASAVVTFNYLGLGTSKDKGTSIIQSLNAVSYYKVGQDDFTPSNDA